MDKKAIVLVKASPQFSQKHGEIVCTAAIDIKKNKWLRLYPLSFRDLRKEQEFGRWDVISFTAEKSQNDPRPESYQVDLSSIKKVGSLKPKERSVFLTPMAVRTLPATSSASLALLKPKKVKGFKIISKETKELEEENRRLSILGAQLDLFGRGKSNLKACPYKFKYVYTTGQKEREGTCLDWETDATFYRWQKSYGETKALKLMGQMFGDEYIKKGIGFAMGTHSKYKDTWLINGIIRVDLTTPQLLGSAQ